MFIPISYTASEVKPSPTTSESVIIPMQKRLVPLPVPHITIPCSPPQWLPSSHATQAAAPLLTKLSIPILTDLSYSLLISQAKALKELLTLINIAQETGNIDIDSLCHAMDPDMEENVSSPLRPILANGGSSTLTLLCQILAPLSQCLQNYLVNFTQPHGAKASGTLALTHLYYAAHLQLQIQLQTQVDSLGLAGKYQTNFDLPTIPLLAEIQAVLADILPSCE